jgi:hypothetical protein
MENAKAAAAAAAEELQPKPQLSRSSHISEVLSTITEAGQPPRQVVFHVVEDRRRPVSLFERPGNPNKKQRRRVIVITDD